MKPYMYALKNALLLVPIVSLIFLIIYIKKDKTKINHKKMNFNVLGIDSYIRLIKNAYFYQFIYNILITVPFGMYLKKYFKLNLFKTILCTFILSLFFELTQLSGLYGVYPRPYRIFDVDDLITNTFGGLIGYFIVDIINKTKKKF